jgi:hypothetical protein
MSMDEVEVGAKYKIKNRHLGSPHDAFLYIVTHISRWPPPDNDLTVYVGFDAYMPDGTIVACNCDLESFINSTIPVAIDMTKPEPEMWDFIRI